MSTKDRRPIENQFHSVETFTTLVLDWLRLGIVTYLLSSQQKNDFIDLIDDALVSQGVQSKLEAELAQFADSCL